MPLIATSLRLNSTQPVQAVILFFPSFKGSLRIPLMKRINESTGYFATGAGIVCNSPFLVALRQNRSPCCNEGDRSYYNTLESAEKLCLVFHYKLYDETSVLSYCTNLFSASKSAALRISAYSPFPGFVPGASSLRSPVRLCLCGTLILLFCPFLPSPIALSRL